MKYCTISINFGAGLSNAIFQKAASFRKTLPQSGTDAGLLSALHTRTRPQADRLRLHRRDHGQLLPQDAQGNLSGISYRRERGERRENHH